MDRSRFNLSRRRFVQGLAGGALVLAGERQFSWGSVPAGGGAMFELSFDEAGRYPFVTHSFRWADAGALGFFEAS